VTRDSHFVLILRQHPVRVRSDSPFFTRRVAGSFAAHIRLFTPCFNNSAPGEQLTNGIVLCRIKSWITGTRMVSLPFSDHCQPLVDDSETLETLMFSLKSDLENEKWKYIEVQAACLVRVRLGRPNVLYEGRTILYPQTRPPSRSRDDISRFPQELHPKKDPARQPRAFGLRRRALCIDSSEILLFDVADAAPTPLPRNRSSGSRISSLAWRSVNDCSCFERRAANCQHFHTRHKAQLFTVWQFRRKIP